MKGSINDMNVKLIASPFNNSQQILYTGFNIQANEKYELQKYGLRVWQRKMLIPQDNQRVQTIRNDEYVSQFEYISEHWQ